MFRNVYYNTKTSKIYLWETEGDKRTQKIIDWVPYVFVPDDKGKTKSIFGDTVKKKQFNSYKEYKEFEKNNNSHENKVKPELQFLSERYHNIPDDKITLPELRICVVDIEVYQEHGFPKPEQAEGFVSSIAINTNNEIKIFGIKEYNGKFKKYFQHCETERELLINFFNYIHTLDIDILTGWYIDGFDLPYLWNRSKKILSKNEMKKLSPINIFKTWEKRDGEGINFDIAGVSIIDYKKLYKRYTRKNPESYKLDDVCYTELKEKKLEYDGTLVQLYNNDWEKYIDYNVQDVQLIWNLEQKLKYMELIQTISLLSKCPMKFYDKVTNVLEGVFLTYYRRNNLCAPILHGGTVEPFKAAYIKKPLKGMYKYVVDFDVTSEYPFVMITCNISPETYFGCIRGLQEKEVIEYTKNRQFPKFKLEKDIDNSRVIKNINGKSLKGFNKLLKNGYFSILPNGSIFETKKEGVVPIVEKIFFQKRKYYKDKMKEADRNGEPKNIVSKYNSYQMGIKVGILNSLYGALSTPYFRLYNLRLAEAITAGGRHTISSAENFINKTFSEFSPEKFVKIEDI